MGNYKRHASVSGHGDLGKVQQENPLEP